MSPTGTEKILDRAWACRCFERVPTGFGRPCGDHDLNPDLRPLRELTPAAVLVPLVNHPGGLTALFTQRNSDMVARLAK